MTLAEVESAKRAYEDARAELEKWERIFKSAAEWYHYVKSN